MSGQRDGAWEETLRQGRLTSCSARWASALRRGRGAPGGWAPGEGQAACAQRPGFRGQSKEKATRRSRQEKIQKGFGRTKEMLSST